MPTRNSTIPKTRAELAEEARKAQRALDLAIERADKAARALEEAALGVEPLEGTVLRFVRTLPTVRDGMRNYSYAAIRAGNLWYLTGQRATGMNWQSLIHFIREGRCAMNVEVLGHDSTLDLS